jgi:hypothetical protein
MIRADCSAHGVTHASHSLTVHGEHAGCVDVDAAGHTKDV